jgi:DNA-binding MarR family transcriptional regulator
MIAVDSPSATAFARFVHAHAAITQRLNAELLERHGLTLSDYQVLLLLARSDDGRLRRVDLVGRLPLTASGVTRLLEGLERDGLVRRAACSSDRRVVYAELSPEGRERVEAAAVTHLDGIRSLFAEHFTDEQLGTLAELLARLPGADVDGEECRPRA